jgi:hypothetical protein
MLDYPAVAALSADIARHNFGAEHVLRAIVEPWSDWLGNDALRVTLVITPGINFSGDDVIYTSLQISDRLLQDGEERPAFVFYATEDELAESDDPES